MKELERVKQYEELNEVLQSKIIDTVTRHNIICNIIEKKEYKKVMELNI